MSKISDTIIWAWRNTVRGVAQQVHREFPEVPYADIAGECCLWLLSRKRTLPAHLSSSSRTPSYKWLLGHARKFAWKELQEMDPSRRPRRLYTNKEMEVFLKVVLRPEMREKAQPSWEEYLDDVQQAYQRLSAYDRGVLSLRYEQRQSLRQMGEILGVSTATADRHVWVAIGHLQDILEGVPEDGEPEKEYVGTGGTLSNAQANAIIRRNE